jgi:hypothetical protein
MICDVWLFVSIVNIYIFVILFREKYGFLHHFISLLVIYNASI